MNVKEMKCWDGLPMSQSSIRCGLRCERCWFLRYRWHLRRNKSKYSAPLDLGTIYHLFMKEGEGNEEVVKQVVRDKQSFLEAEILKGDDLDDSLTKQYNSLTSLYHKAEAIAHIFWDKYPRSERQETIVREQHIVVDDIEGTLDEIEIDRRVNAIAIRDTKTTSRSLDTILTGYPYGVQLRVYRFLAEEWCRQNGLPAPQGFIIDAVLMPTIKLCKKDEKEARITGCTAEEAYRIRVENWYAENGKTSMVSSAMKFNEPIVPAELDHAFETIRELARRKPDPMNYERDITGSYCMAYERQCSFYSLCTKHPSMWPVELDGYFEVWEREGKGEL